MQESGWLIPELPWDLQVRSCIARRDVEPSMGIILITARGLVFLLKWLLVFGCLLMFRLVDQKWLEGLMRLL